MKLALKLTVDIILSMEVPDGSDADEIGERGAERANQLIDQIKPLPDVQRVIGLDGQAIDWSIYESAQQAAKMLADAMANRATGENAAANDGQPAGESAAQDGLEVTELPVDTIILPPSGTLQ